MKIWNGRGCLCMASLRMERICCWSRLFEHQETVKWCVSITEVYVASCIHRIICTLDHTICTRMYQYKGYVSVASEYIDFFTVSIQQGGDLYNTTLHTQGGKTYLQGWEREGVWRRLRSKSRLIKAAEGRHLWLVSGILRRHFTYLRLLSLNSDILAERSGKDETMSYGREPAPALNLQSRYRSFSFFSNIFFPQPRSSSSSLRRHLCPVYASSSSAQVPGCVGSNSLKCLQPNIMQAFESFIWVGYEEVSDKEKVRLLLSTFLERLLISEYSRFTAVVMWFAANASSKFAYTEVSQQSAAALTCFSYFWQYFLQSAFTEVSD